MTIQVEGQNLYDVLEQLGQRRPDISIRVLSNGKIRVEHDGLNHEYSAAQTAAQAVRKVLIERQQQKQALDREAAAWRNKKK